VSVNEQLALAWRGLVERDANEHLAEVRVNAVMLVLRCFIDTDAFA